MVRQKTPMPVQSTPSRSPSKPKRKAGVPAAKDWPTLQVVHQIKEAGKQTHLWVAKTRMTYARHVGQACKWLKGHFLAEGTQPSLSHVEDDSEIYGDPNFKDAFEHIPNWCSDKALALYLSWRGFQEQCSQMMVPRSVGIGTMMMCAVDGKYIQLAMAGLESLVILSKELKSLITQHIEQLAFSSVAFTLWTRNYELVKLKCRDIGLDCTAIDGMFLKYLQSKERLLTINDLSTYFEVHLRNWKGWQRKLDKGMKEINLQSNCYKIYLRLDMGMACNPFLWVMLWIRWVELYHLGCPMAKGDFLFPTVGANGVLQPGKLLSHDTTQKWISEVVVGSGICGIINSCFALLGSDGPLHVFGGGVDGQMVNIDVLGPISWDADVSLAGEASLVQPASTEALHLAHASLMADVAALHTKVNNVYTSQAAMSDNVKDMCNKFGDMSNWVQKALTSAPACNHNSPHWSMVTVSPFATDKAHHNSSSTFSCMDNYLAINILSIHSSCAPCCLTFGLVMHASHNASTSSTSSWLEHDNSDTPESWKEGDPKVGLYVPLKDWPHHYYNGQHGWKFNTKYYQWSIIATEYIHEFQENKVAFLNVYGSAAHQGHMELWKTIVKAQNWYHGDGQCYHYVIDEACCNNSPTPQSSDES
ncbi:hypothetical protein J3A83DRAFT_4190563 [Scleroderma citrinum]